MTDWRPTSASSITDAGALAQLAADLGSATPPTSALEFYLRLERSTRLLDLHLLPRKGLRNQYRSGIQQSYGDHCRLLMLGIDRLDSLNGEWFLQRGDPADPPGEPLLRDCLRRYEGRRHDGDRIAMWLAAGLHDFGKLHQTAYRVDAEDAVLLVASILDALCAPESRGLVEFGIRFHDLIEHVSTGEVPVKTLRDALLLLPPGQHSLALMILGVLQLAGAASLGEGRVNNRKLNLFADCLDQTALSDLPPKARLQRLLSAGDDSAQNEAVWLTHRDSLAEFIDGVSILGWHAMWHSDNDRSILQRADCLLMIADTWKRHFPRSTYVILSSELRPAAMTTPSLDSRAITLANGKEVVIFTPPGALL